MPNPLRRRKLRTRYATRRDGGYTEREVFTAESGFDRSRLLSASKELSLFANRRLLELRIPTGKPGKDGAEAMARYCERLPEKQVSAEAKVGSQTVKLIYSIEYQVSGPALADPRGGDGVG